MKVIYEVITGSRAHGTADASSDLDIRGAYLPSAAQLFGFEPIKPVAWMTPYDATFYPIKSFVEMALAANPNILELLFVEDEHIRRMDEFGRELRVNRRAFLSRRLYHSYSGFARKSLHRLEAGRPGEQTRLPLIAKYGFDTKDASHMIRCLRTGLEALTIGSFRTKRPEHECEELQAIRRGEFTLDEVFRLERELEAQLAAALPHSPLPEEPNFALVTDLLIDLQRRAVVKRAV